MDTMPTVAGSRRNVLVPTNVLRPRSPGSRKLPVVGHLSSGPQASAKLERTPLTSSFLRQGFAVVEPNVLGAAGFGHSFELLDDGRKRLDSFEDVAALCIGPALRIPRRVPGEDLQSESVRGVL